MNERIEELARQCMSMRFFVDTASEDFDYKKFAELIVKECAKFMDENSGYNDSDGCWFPEPEDMLKHFGVTE
jgi:hypothetical protein